MAKRTDKSLVGLIFVIGLVLIAYLVGQSFRSGPGKPDPAGQGPTGPAQTGIPGTIRIVAPQGDHPPGEPVTIRLFLEGLSGVQGVDFNLRFEPAELQVDVEGSERLEDEIVPGECPHPDFVVRRLVDNDTGMAGYAAVSTSGPCNQGLLASFQVICRAEGTFALSMDGSVVSDSSGAELQHSTIPAEITCRDSKMAEDPGPAEPFDGRGQRHTLTPLQFAGETAQMVNAAPPQEIDAAGTPTQTSAPRPTTVTADAGSDALSPADLVLYIPLLANQAAQLSVTPGTQIVSAVGSFTLRADGFKDLFGADIALSFDPSIVHITQLTPGNCPAPDLVVESSFDNVLGQIDYALTQLSPTPPCSGGVLFSAAFACMGSGSGVIVFDSSLLANQAGLSIPHKTVTGIVACE